MTMHKLTDLQIKVRIVPTRVRWPDARVSLAWAKAHGCVDALQNLVRDVDNNCLRAESNGLSAGDVRRRRTEICDQTLRKLVNFAAFDIAERALSESILALERLSERDREQVQMLQQLKLGLRDLEEGIGATKRMVLERCKMREGVAV